MRYCEKGLVTALRSALLCSGLLGLSACGGGGGGGGNVRPDPPPAPVTTPPAPPPPVVSAPNPAYSQHINLTNAAVAHQSGFTGSGVRIGVVDSGVTRNHPALSPRVVANLNYVPSPPNNLAVDDVAQHGTAVSQIAAGTAFGAWPGGIAPGAEIVSARILYDKDPEDDGTGQGNEIDGAVGLKGIHQDLINRGVRVMNNSWGGLYWTNPAATAPIADEYRPFIIGNNGLVVFATGNAAMLNPSSMAALPSQPGLNGTFPAADLERGWLAVTAVNPSTLQLDVGSDGVVYANACGIALHYCLAAPGTVVVTGTNDAPTSPSYWRWAGTSLAAPQVSGAAALVWQAFPYFSNDMVRQTLLGTARDLGVPGVDITFGYGLLDAGKAVRGPGRFDWGDVTAAFDGVTSAWSNGIEGAGGLIKQGTGTLVLDYTYYTGATQVQGGILRVQGGLNGTSSTSIAPGAQLELRNAAGLRGNVANNGTLAAYSTQMHQINGSYVQAPTARLAIEVGTFLNFSGTAQLNGGELHVLGKAAGYVPAASQRETFLRASGGLSGTFGSLTAAPGVLLQATIGYDAMDAWLNVSRLDVTAAAQSMGLSPTAQASGQRVEGAFDAIDEGQLTGSPGSTTFIAGAGAIQGAPTAAAAERTLDSLSGELHGADIAFAMIAIEGNRRALEARVDALQSAPVAGAWADGLKAQRVVSQFDVDADGWMLGQDRRLGDRLTVGMALAGTEGYAHHDLRYDREHNRQAEAQFYGSYDLGRGYLLGSVALGRMQRWTQRDLLLGNESFRVEADYAHRYASAGLQAGLPIVAGRGRVTPYAGVQVLQLDRDGFDEQGGLGFGLSTDASTMKLGQALLGARFAYDWSVGSTLWTLQGRAEWQHLLSQSGGDIDARFSALDVWSPIVGEALGRDVGVLGFGLGTRLRRGGRIDFDFDAQHDHGQTWTRAMATWSVGF